MYTPKIDGMKFDLCTFTLWEIWIIEMVIWILSIISNFLLKRIFGNNFVSKFWFQKLFWVKMLMIVSSFSQKKHLSCKNFGKNVWNLNVKSFSFCRHFYIIYILDAEKSFQGRIFSMKNFYIARIDRFYYFSCIISIWKIEWFVKWSL